MKYFLFSFLLLFSFSTFGQANLLKKNNATYFYKGKAIECEALGELYKVHEESLKLYSNGRNFLKAAKMLTYLGLPFVIGGIVGLRSDSIESEIFGGRTLIVGLLIELVALIPRFIGKEKMYQAMKRYNFEVIKRGGYIDDVSLSFSQTNNGLGLVLSF